MSEAVYDPGCYDVTSLAEAQSIILTPEAGLTSAARWRDETPYLVGLIEQHLKPRRGMVLLDYGCGVGRLARPILGMHGCAIIGVDTSSSMRALSASCVDSPGFVAIHPDLLHLFGGEHAHAAMSVWTLQHCLHPATAIFDIWRSLKPKAPLFVVNNVRRAVPCTGGTWADDGIDIKTLLGSAFECLDEGRLPLLDATFWGVYRKTGDMPPEVSRS